MARAVLVFTHSGRETTEQLATRCRRSKNPRLRDLAATVGAVLAVECKGPQRQSSDRQELLNAVLAVRRAQGDERRAALPLAADMCRAVQELKAAVAALSAERRQVIQEKIASFEKGLVSLPAVRHALQEARLRQVDEDRQVLETGTLGRKLASAQSEADKFRGAATSIARRGPAALQSQQSHAFACCTPACGEACVPCNDGAQAMLHHWRKEREDDIVRRFAEADAEADALEAAIASRERARASSPVRSEVPQRLPRAIPVHPPRVVWAQSQAQQASTPFQVIHAGARSGTWQQPATPTWVTAGPAAPSLSPLQAR